MVEKVFDVIKSNLRNPKFYIAVLVLVIIFLVLFPYLDANIFYYNRVKNRVEILSKLSEMDIEKIREDEVLSEEYNRILAEVDKQSDGSIGSIIIRESTKDVLRIKFITGGAVFWLLAILCIFMKTFEKPIHKIIAIVFLGVLGFLLGLLARIIPTVINPLVNYIGFPVLILTLVALLVSGNNAGKEKKNGT